MTDVRTVATMSEIKQTVDTYLQATFSQRAELARAISPDYAALWEMIGDLSSSGGKRIRPYLVYLAYSAYSDAPLEDIIPALGAQEMLHQAMLIHDDVIDRDDVRYGVPNLVGRYREQYATEPFAADDPNHFGASAAILAGDLLISESAQSLMQVKTSDALKIQALSVLHNAIFRVVGGELLDTEAAIRTSGAASPRLIAIEKTASYSFISPLTMGAILAGASETEVELLRSIGHAIGIAYQMHDDILGIFGDEAITGKSASSDLTEGKRTGIIERFEAIADEDTSKTFFAGFGRSDADDTTIDLLRTIIQTSGALDAQHAEIARLSDSARADIARLHIPEASRQALLELIELCTKRDY